MKSSMSGLSLPTKVIRSNRRSMALYVQPDQTLLIKAPFLTPQIVINRFISEHKDWIDKQTQKLQKGQKFTNRTYKDGDTFLFLGKEYQLSFGTYSEISIKDDKLLFPQVLQFRVKKELTNWYVRQAREIITRQLDHFAREMNVTYNGLMFSDTSSKWGSCTHDNRLQFNWRLVMAPILVINYVVIHELAHTIEKNHSLWFWNKVRLYTPSYKQQRKWLEEHGDLLIV